MQKITESQLRDRIRSLQEKMATEDQKVDEWSLLSPSSWFNGRGYGDSTDRDTVRAQDAATNAEAGRNEIQMQQAKADLEQLKQAIAKLQAMATPAAGAAPAVVAAKESTSYFLNKLRMLEAAAPANPARDALVKQITDLQAKITQAYGGDTVPAEVQAIFMDAGKAIQASQAAAAAPAQSPEELAAAQKANGVDPATGQMISMKDPKTGQMINPEDGLPVTPQVAAAPDGSGKLQLPPGAAPEAGTTVAAGGGGIRPTDVTQGGKPATPAVAPQDGAVGQDLAKMGVSKQNRLDQAFVDKTLGAGKYKAGSAESNLALQAKMKQNGGAAPAAPAAPAAAPPTTAAAPAAAGVKPPPPGIVPAAGTKPNGTPGQRPTNPAVVAQQQAAPPKPAAPAASAPAQAAKPAAPAASAPAAPKPPASAPAAAPRPKEPGMLDRIGNFFKEGDMTEQELVKFKDDQALARIIDLTRR